MASAFNGMACVADSRGRAAHERDVARGSLPVPLITVHSGAADPGAGHPQLAPGMKVLGKPLELDVPAERVAALIAAGGPSAMLT